MARLPVRVAHSRTQRCLAIAAAQATARWPTPGPDLDTGRRVRGQMRNGSLPLTLLIVPRERAEAPIYRDWR